MKKLKVNTKSLNIIQEAIAKYEEKLSYSIDSEYNQIYIYGDEDFFIHCREACIDLMDYKGFDQGYELTTDGVILQDIIDKIHDLV